MILNHEGADTEQLISRQNVKLAYLQQENDMINQDIQDLRKALDINKEALKVALK